MAHRTCAKAVSAFLGKRAPNSGTAKSMVSTLESKIALVTGAAGDIGRAIACALAAAGADVAVHDRASGPALSAVASEVRRARQSGA